MNGKYRIKIIKNEIFFGLTPGKQYKNTNLSFRFLCEKMHCTNPCSQRHLVNLWVRYAIFGEARHIYERIYFNFFDKICVSTVWVCF